MRAECKIPRAELERRLAAGRSYRRIAHETGYGEASVSRRCRSLGLPPPARPHGGVASSVPDEVIRELIVQVDLSIRGISRRIGLSDVAVIKRARRLGLSTGREERTPLALQVAA